MIEARGTTPLNPRGLRNDTGGQAVIEARRTTPLNPRGLRNDTGEQAR